MSSLASARSLLFAPGNDGHKLEKALSAGADVVVADLEDAVPAGEKDAARRLVAEQLAERRTESPVAVRVNGTGTPFRDDDLRAVAALPLDVLVVPKATPAAIAELSQEGPPVVAVVESARGVKRAYETASAPGVAALALGAVDLGLELGLEPRPDGQEVRLARSLGFRGKLCIHPAQVEVVNRIFSPREDEVEHARRVVDVYERSAAEGRGVVALDGEMVDLPVVERARQVLAQAERSAPDGS